ncbi:MAG: STAS/SEC14 domain-containing protein [Cytophagales bacterium]|nr:STAS/SEC14 domain-containing protein [Bernardetiaceae bacterium]MDW8211684.1 STAS/SEC14 domain-containing protein [Cytophagales bacterium]
MQRLYETHNFTLDYDPHRSLAIQHWFGNMTEEEYKANMHILVEWMLKLPGVRFTLVYPNLNFPITPDLQEWTKLNVFEPTAHKGLEKAAFIVPPAVFEQIMIEFLSVEQTMEEAHGIFQVKYFTSEEEAFKWFSK